MWAKDKGDWFSQSGIYSEKNVFYLVLGRTGLSAGIGDCCWSVNTNTRTKPFWIEQLGVFIGVSGPNHGLPGNPTGERTQQENLADIKGFFPQHKLIQSQLWLQEISKDEFSTVFSAFPVRLKPKSQFTRIRSERKEKRLGKPLTTNTVLEQPVESHNVPFILFQGNGLRTERTRTTTKTQTEIMYNKSLH